MVKYEVDGMGVLHVKKVAAPPAEKKAKQTDEVSEETEQIEEVIDDEV